MLSLCFMSQPASNLMPVSINCRFARVRESHESYHTGDLGRTSDADCLGGVPSWKQQQHGIHTTASPIMLAANPGCRGRRERRLNEEEERRLAPAR